MGARLRKVREIKKGERYVVVEVATGIGSKLRKGFHLGSKVY